MIEDEQEQAKLEGEASNTGGAAPAQRRCRYTKADGKPCRDWTVRGQDYCHRHDVFLHERMDRPINVPLLEDESSIVLLLSETLRALAWGTIPVGNGRMLVEGCRLAHTIYTQKLEAAKFRLRLRRMGIPEQEIFDPPVAEQDVERGAGSKEPGGEGAAMSEEEPLTTPLLQPPNQKRRSFRNLKKNWENELGKGAAEMFEMSAHRNNETRKEWEAAHATPFDHLAEVDREVERAQALGKAHEEGLAKAQAEGCSVTC